jgi:hypothetical protein
MIKLKPWPPGGVLAILFICTLGLSPGLWAQQAGQTLAPATTQTQTKFANDASAAPIEPTPDPKVPQNDRILWALPNNLTVEEASSLPPLTAGQKFALTAKDSFDPVVIGFIGLETGINQASNTNPTFGQGLKGYSKRYGVAFADNAIGNFMTSAIFPSALHQDPRFYRLGSGGFFRRAVYAGSRVLVTRTDGGRAQVNYSEILGNGVAAAISNAYHPGPRTLSSNISIWGTQVGYDLLSFEMKEFWPDIHRLFARHHQNM